jgi:4-hydroxy-tetrahydrodipicolinate synthase
VLPRLTGVIPPLITPFAPGSQDLDEPAPHTELGYRLETGVQALTACGSTGEGHRLLLEESGRCAEAGVLQGMRA